MMTFQQYTDTEQCGAVDGVGARTGGTMNRTLTGVYLCSSSSPAAPVMHRSGIRRKPC
jgi:hypothetical protein